MRIKQLSAYLANQIAAGEVIERPASVLKELLENSLDAGADVIEVEVEKGGLKSLHVTDNGSGIHKEDLLLAVSPHATSKLQDPEDLFNIHTLGFRGEALASIGSVARLQLTSAQEAEAAWQISVEGKHISPLVPAAHPQGTSICIQDLFFNTPARRKFLRSDKTEYNHLEEVFRRIALSHYNVSLIFKHNQKRLYHLPAALTTLTQEKRISKIFGSGFLQHALRLDFAIPGIKLWGWLGLPQHSRSQVDLQYVYLNGRMIRDKLVNHAIRTAYEDKLYPGRYPLFLLYLDIEPDKVDVNVHPTKHEVRFHDSRLVHDFIYQTIRESLESETQPVKGLVKEFSRPETASSVNFYELASAQAGLQCQEPKPESYKILGVLQGTYLLAEHTQGLLMVDLPQALWDRYASHSAKAQPKALLIPLTLSLNERQVSLFELHLEALEEQGVMLSILGQSQVMLRGLPEHFIKLNPRQFINLLITQLENLSSGLDKEKLFQAVISAASQSADFTNLDMQMIMPSLQNLQQQKAFRIVNLDKLAKLVFN